MTTLTNQTRVSGTIETIVDIGNLAERICERMLLPASLSLAQLRILSLADGRITPGQLAAQLRQETHSVSGLLNRLEDQDLVERARDKVDRRVVHVGLTRAGRELQAQATRMIEGVTERIDQLIGPGLRDELSEVREDLMQMYSEIVTAARLAGTSD